MSDVAVLRLKNGEMLIAGVRAAEDNMVWLDNPIAVVPFQTSREGVQGETFILKPWIGISDDKSFLVSGVEILTSCSLKDSLLEQYKSYVGDPAVIPHTVEDELDLLQSRILRSRGLLN